MKKLGFNGFLRRTRCLILLFPVIYDTWRFFWSMCHLRWLKPIRGWEMLEIRRGNPVIYKARGGGGDLIFDAEKR